MMLFPLWATTKKYTYLHRLRQALNIHGVLGLTYLSLYLNLNTAKVRTIPHDQIL